MEHMRVRAYRGHNVAAHNVQRAADIADSVRDRLAQWEREAKAMLAQIRAERIAERDAREIRHYGRKLSPKEREKVVKDRKSILKAIKSGDVESVERHRLRLKSREKRIRKRF